MQRHFKQTRQKLTGRQEGGFVKGWFWRMYPRSGFRSGGTCERTLVPVFVSGDHPNVPSFRFSFWGNTRQNHPFGNHPFGNPRKTEVRHLCVKLYRTRGTPVKRDRKLPAQKTQGMVHFRTRSERDTNLPNLTHYLRP